MSVRHAGPWHYEFVPDRARWRVADVDDDFIIDYATEIEAEGCVLEHNRKWDEYVRARGWLT